MNNNNFDLFTMKVEEVDTPYDNFQEKSNKNIDLLNLEYKDLKEYLNKMCDVQTYIDIEINKKIIKINEDNIKKNIQEKIMKENKKNNKLKCIKNSINEISKGFDRLEETLKKFKPYN